MYETLLEQIDHAIEASRGALVQDIIKLININSVKEEPQRGAPFGPGPRTMLDAVLEMGKKVEFRTTDYKVGVVSLALKEGQPDLGIWVHGDVVPAGEGWINPPFHATEYKGCIIGRGANDNKGQLAAMFHVLKIFKDLDISLKYNPALYVGSDEENGMHDLIGIPGNEDAKGFCNVCTQPRLSLVPDAIFPVGYGGKGTMNAVFRSKRPLHGLTITAGQEKSPGKAVAVFYGQSIVTNSPPRHSSNPDPNGNMITMLMKRLLDREETISEDRSVLEFFKMLSLDTNGNRLGINVESKMMRPVTVFAQKICTSDGYPEITVNIRYPIEITYEEIVKQLKMVAEEYGAELIHADSILKPYLLDPEQPVVQMLNAIANDITGDTRSAYTLSGGTYAHMLSNALVYGVTCCVRPEGFSIYRGAEHGMDELVSVNHLQTGMRIYARALLALNEIEW